MSGYSFTFQDKTFTPDGALDIAASDVERHNRETEERELAWLKTAPEKVLLYVKQPEKDKSERLGNAHYCDVEYRYKVTTWLGTVLAHGANCWIGEKVHTGFGYHTYRRPVSCRIFGVLYHGWYMESSGDYCRLRKAKRQGGRP